MENKQTSQLCNTCSARPLHIFPRKIQRSQRYVLGWSLRSNNARWLHTLVVVDICWKNEVQQMMTQAHASQSSSWSVTKTKHNQLKIGFRFWFTSTSHTASCTHTNSMIHLALIHSITRSHEHPSCGSSARTGRHSTAAAAGQKLGLPDAFPEVRGDPSF